MARKTGKTRPKRSIQTLSPEAQIVQNTLGAASASARQRYRTAAAGARGLRGALAERAQALTHAYDATDEAGKQADAAASQSLANLGSTADPFRAIVAGESASGVRRAAEARAAASDELGKMRTSIERGKISQQNQIAQDLQSTIDQIANTSLATAGKAKAQATQTRLQGRITRSNQAANARQQGKITAANQAAQAERQGKITRANQAANARLQGRITRRNQAANRRGKDGKGASAKLPGSPSARSKALQGIAATLKTKPPGFLSTRGQRHQAIGGLVTKGGFEPDVAVWAVHAYASRVAKPKKGGGTPPLRKPAYPKR